MELFKIAQTEARENGSLVNTIVKEILHYDIMEALYRSDAVQDIVFQGGTALRLCYGGNRYSEDLDFVLKEGSSFTPELMKKFESIFVTTVKNKYGLKAKVDLPKERDTDKKGVNVDKWTAKVLIPSKSMQQPKINIEIADVPSYDNELKFIQSNYGSVSTTSALYVESLEEIMADKIIAVAGREYFKARDFWDIKWLQDKGIKIRKDLIELKKKDYSIENFSEKFRAKIELLDQPKIQSLFKKEMERFLDIDTIKIIHLQGGIDSILNASRNLTPIVASD